MSRESGANQVVVIGSGVAGLCAAVAASESGARVTILEKAAWVGGASAYSAGKLWVGANHIARGCGCPDDSIEMTVTYVRSIARVSSVPFDEALVRRWSELSQHAVAFLDAIGAVAWNVIPDYPDYYLDAEGATAEGRYLRALPVARDELSGYAATVPDSPHFPVGLTDEEVRKWGGLSRRADWDEATLADRKARGVVTFGGAIVARLARAAHERGVTVRLQTQASALIRSERGEVSGVLSRGPDGEQRFGGRVVVASGSYDWARQQLGTSPIVQYMEPASFGPKALTGDGLHLGQSVGAQADVLPEWTAPMYPGYRRPGADVEDPQADGGWRRCMEHSLPHSIIVNSQGRRFCDDSFHRDLLEAVFRDVTSAGRSVHLPMYMIWDQQHRQKYGLGGVPGFQPYPEGMVNEAPSISRIAKAIGVPPLALESTIGRFNRYAKGGKDPDFGRGTNLSVQVYRGDTLHEPNPNLGPIEVPPFYAMEISLVPLAIGASGLRTDLDARLLDDADTPIPGLYAAGSVCSMAYAAGGYNSGYALGRALGFGVRAGQLAACE